ncbi:unnamed protein product [Pedinophyceae sp. YPF-701]|nr:unnamed protein product [Pedinophyceae sp. YPF-701]
MATGQRELTQKFKVQKFLGKGSYGSVYRVKRISDGKVYALKETDVKHMNQTERAEAVNEIRLMASVMHPNVVSYHEAFIDGNKLCIVMEFAPYGDLARAIRKGQAMKKPFPEDMIWSFFIQACEGVYALHHARILHRDVKAANLLITAADAVKIGDLGIAKFMKTGMTKTQIGTPHYMPPEVWKNRAYGYSSDVWALGCLLYEMATFTVPFEARSMSELRYKVMRGRYTPVPRLYSADLSNLVSALLDPSPDARPTLEQILSSEAVQRRRHLLPGHLQEGGLAPAMVAEKGGLLDTIQVPRNLKLLQNRLPAPQYPDEAEAGEGKAGGDANGDAQTWAGPQEPARMPAAHQGPRSAVSDPPVQARPSPGRAGWDRSPESVSSRPEGRQPAAYGRGAVMNTPTPRAGGALAAVDNAPGYAHGAMRPSEFNKPGARRVGPAAAAASRVGSRAGTNASQGSYNTPRGGNVSNRGNGGSAYSRNYGPARGAQPGRAAGNGHMGGGGHLPRISEAAAGLPSIPSARGAAGARRRYY